MYIEIAKVQQSGKAPPKDQKYVDIYREKPIKVTVKVLVPVREHPKVSRNEKKNKNGFEMHMCLLVQFRWQTVGTKRQFTETFTRGDHV